MARPRPWAEREWVTLLRRLVRRRTALFGMIVVLVVMLAADKASFVNGACITIDGGQRKAIMDT